MHFMRILLLLTMLSEPAMAYFDPASGSILLQGLLAGLAGLLLTGRIFWARVKEFFNKLFGKETN